MRRRKLLQSIGVLTVLVLLSMQTSKVFAAYTIEGVQNWYLTNETYVNKVVVGDVNADGKAEIITGGAYRDGSHWVAQLSIWSGSSLNLKDTKTWDWGSDTWISSVALGDVDGDGKIEIITSGYYYDGTRDVAQLCVWSGATLALENIRTWYWVDDTYGGGVAVGDVDDDGKLEIVTGGSYFDGTRGVAQVCVWSGGSLALEDVTAWYWTGYTSIYSIAVGDVDDDGKLEIVTGGTYFDGSDVAQLCVWNGASLALEDVATWDWPSYNFLHSVAIGDVDGDGKNEIVTGGFWYSAFNRQAQLCVWNGASLALEDVATWLWGSETSIGSVAVNDVDGDGQMEIVTGGSYHNGIGYAAQLCVWNGATLGLEDVTAWFWPNHTTINSVVVRDVDNDGQKEIITGGLYAPSSYWVAQLCVWG